MTNRAHCMTAAAGLAVVLLGLAMACKTEPSGSGPTEAASKRESATAIRGKVAKIVFIGKQNACDCTRKRVDDSLAALTAALAGHSAITTEQYQIDVDQPAIQPFQKMGAIMVLPAIYLVDASGGLIEVLQGEVTTEQIKALL